MKTLLPSRARALRVAFAVRLQNHPALQETFRKTTLLTASAAMMAALSFVIFIVSAMVLRFSPVEPLQAEGLGEIISTQTYLNVSAFTGKAAAGKAQPFYFTTLHTMSVANRWDALRSSLFLKNSNQEKIKSYGMSRELDMTPNDYARLSRFSLNRSSENIAWLAFLYAGKPVDFPSKVEVVFVYDLYRTGKAFEPHDVIAAVNGRKIGSWADYADVLNSLPLQEGYTAQFTVIRSGKTLDIPVTFREKDNYGAFITGFYAAEVEDFGSALRPNELVTFTSNFSGGSAGLMMTLELVQELSGRDLTKGYKIAGTGTIDKNGAVGEIGGMPLKVITAHERGVDLFFVPKAQHPEDTNEKEAMSAARRLGTPMTIVPVANVSEALAYLEHLPVKPAK